MIVDPAKVSTLAEKLDVWVALETALRDAVNGILDLLDISPQNQSLRRALIRALWGFVEGSVQGLGDFLRMAWILSTHDGSVVNEERCTTDRVKSTLKSAGRDLAGWEPDFGASGWAALRDSLKVRDRLMHPKAASGVIVSDDEVETAKDGAAWFLSTIIEIQNRALQRSSR